MRLPETGGTHVVGLLHVTDGHVPTQHIGVNTHAVGGVRVLADQDNGIAAGRGHRAHAVPRFPQASPRRPFIEQAEFTDRRHGQRHVLECDHASAAELMHAGAARLVDDDVDARTATDQLIVRILIPWRGRDTHSPEGIHGLGQGLATHAAYLPGDHAGLPGALGDRSQVREFTTADTSGTCLRPNGLHAIFGGGEDLDGIRPCELLLDGGHARTNDLAGCRVAYEDNASVLVTGDARAAVRGFTDGQLEDLTDPLAGLRVCGATTLRRAATGRTVTHEDSSAVSCALAGCSAWAFDSDEVGAPTRKNGSLTR